MDIWKPQIAERMPGPFLIRLEQSGFRLALGSRRACLNPLGFDGDGSRHGPISDAMSPIGNKFLAVCLGHALQVLAFVPR
jgi:hypothetical protein